MMIARAGWVAASRPTASEATLAPASSTHAAKRLRTLSRTAPPSMPPLRSISLCISARARLTACSPLAWDTCRDVPTAVMSEAPPLPSVAGHEVARTLRAPGAGLIVGTVVGIRRMGAPAVEDCRAEAPRLLHLVLACKERGVAEHAVEQQALVRLGRFLEERAAVQEVHVDGADRHRLPRRLRTDAQGDPLVGLDAQHEEVGI